MVIYVDILVILNFLVDYFLFLSAGFILKRKVNTFRYILGALIGGISSMYIFLPIENIWFDFLSKLLICSACTAVIFGFKGLKNYFKSVITVFSVTVLYAGVMISFWHIFKPDGMLVKNSVVYFNISPIILIGLTVVLYFLFIVLSLIFKPSSVKSEKCDITLVADGNKTVFTAIIDSGNSINDAFGKSDIIIADRAVAVSLFGNTDIKINNDLKRRYRAVPCGTVSGCDILEGFRCDQAEIKAPTKTVTLEKPVLAISQLPISDGYEGIVNPEIFE